MAKSKVISTKSLKPVTGGKGHMFGKQSVGTKKPGVTGKSDKGGGGKWAKGGGGHMAGKQTSSPSQAGRTAK